jgi:hypothetical protein
MACCLFNIHASPEPILYQRGRLRQPGGSLGRMSERAPPGSPAESTEVALDSVHFLH